MVSMAKKFIVIVDESKLVDGLGISGAMPVEIHLFVMNIPCAKF